MSYDLWLESSDGIKMENDEKHHLRGGTYAVGGTRDLYLNVTFNYSPFFQKAFENEKGLRILENMINIDSLDILLKGRRQLTGVPSSNYWEATEGNARKALSNLISLGLLAPDDAIWRMAY